MSENLRQGIRIESATRVDLSGGTLDCWPIYLLLRDCRVVNLSINVFTGVELKEREDASIKLVIADLDYEKKFVNREAVLSCQDKELTLIKPHLQYWSVEKGFSLKTYSRSPVGGGLGGSSSLCISILKAFLQWQGQRMSVNEMVRLSSNIEAKILRTPTGTQDYFPAVHPGLSIIDYSVDDPQQTLVNGDLDWVEKNMFLVYTGRAHHSGINNWEVLQKAVDGDNHTLECLRGIANISDEMANVVLNGDWHKIPGLFQKEYQVRTDLCDSFTSPEIRQLSELTLQAGAEAVKICGAGGGGCVLVWSAEERKDQVIDACQKHGFEVIPIQPVTLSGET